MYQKTYHMVYTGIFAVLLCICSWISIPTVIPFTLQTFGVFLTILLLGGKHGSIAIFIYLMLGAIGIPVFSGFGAGLGYLFGNTGGFALGFLLIGLCAWFFETYIGKKMWLRMFALLLGLFLCYSFGTFWFMNISIASGTSYGLLTTLSVCVFPFVIPDICKLIFAYMICRRIRPLLKT